MKFGETLKNSVREEWAENYIDYDKLKELLRENDPELKDWTEQDESNFVEEMVNVQIEKVNAFHSKVGIALKERVNACESRLEPFAKSSENKDTGTEVSSDSQPDENTRKLLEEVNQELDSISKEIASLYKFSRINFTACLKAAKKHDRLKKYKVRPLVQVRLSALPFSSEDYSPLLYRISALYAFTRQLLKNQTNISAVRSKTSGRTYESHKFWVHPDNLLEVKTYILRRLPVLIYNPQTAKVAKANQKDPKLTSLYFDNPQFSMYTHKLDRYESAASVRLRWYGLLAEKPDITLERKIVPAIDEIEETGTEEKISLKEKEIQDFISGDAILGKKIQKTNERKPQEEAQKYEKTARDLSNFVKEHSLQPMFRAVYTRTAFQIPGDDEIRISLDTDLAFIKEDSLNSSRPIRSADDWHRHDIDDQKMEYPFNSLPKEEISKFPFALLEIKILSSLDARSMEWVSDLMNSHLVHDSPRFSKFIHGVSVLFEDNVNSFPFWLGDLDKDIRKDPKDAWQQEQEKLKQQEENEFAVGSLAMAIGSPFRSALAREPIRHNEQRSRRLSDTVVKRKDFETRKSVTSKPIPISEEPEPLAEDHITAVSSRQGVIRGLNGWRSNKRSRSVVKLPPGVQKPSTYIKDSGPLQVEAKVWLANQRTFIKWEHICVLLGGLSLALVNAAGKHNNVALGIGGFFTGISIFTGAWGYWMYIRRSNWITNRSEKGFDSGTSLIGPIVVCVTLIVALTLNFLFKFRIAFTESFYLQDLSELTTSPNDSVSPLVIQGANVLI